jgi:hypothetical protein
VSIYLFSDTSQFNRISKVALFGTTAFVLSVLTVAPSFAQEVVFKECSSCKGEGLASSLTATAGGESIGGQIYTTGLAADEMDAGLQEKAESYAIASGGVADYRETEGSSLLDLLKKDADADSQRKVYIPENSNPVAKKKTVQKSEVPAFKEASLNITPEEERYLRDGSSYVAGRAPAAQITASLVFDDYSQYADGVKVAPIATYKAALKKAEANSAESAKVQKKDVVKTALVVAEPEASVDAIFSDNSVAGNSIPAESEPKDMFVSAPIPTPAFADSLAVTGSSSFNDNAKAVGSDVAAGELSPLEALLMSDDSSKVASNNNISAAGSSIPAFSNSLNMNAALNVEPKSEQKK